LAGLVKLIRAACRAFGRGAKAGEKAGEKIAQAAGDLGETMVGKGVTPEGIPIPVPKPKPTGGKPTGRPKPVGKPVGGNVRPQPPKIPPEAKMCPTVPDGVVTKTWIQLVDGEYYLIQSWTETIGGKQVCKFVRTLITDSNLDKFMKWFPLYE
jgi:hypothetical protein